MASKEFFRQFPHLGAPAGSIRDEAPPVISGLLDVDSAGAVPTTAVSESTGQGQSQLAQAIAPGVTAVNPRPEVPAAQGQRAGDLIKQVADPASGLTKVKLGRNGELEVQGTSTPQPQAPGQLDVRPPGSAIGGPLNLSVSGQPQAQPGAAPQGGTSFADKVKSPLTQFVLGSIARAIGGDDSVGGRLGQVGQSLAQSKATTQATEDAKAGRPISPGIRGILDPKQQAEIAELALAERRAEATERYQDAIAAGVAPYEEKFVQEQTLALIRNMNHTAKPPNIQMFKQGDKQVYGYFTPEGQWFEMGVGTRTDDQGLTDNQAILNYFRTDDKIREISNKEFAHLGEIYVDEQGRTSLQFKSAQGRELYNGYIAGKIWQEQAQGNLPNRWFGQSYSQGAPPQGAIVDGFRFKGGDPSNKSNWEKVSY